MKGIYKKLKPLHAQWLQWRKYAIPTLLVLTIWSVFPLAMGHAYENLAMLELARYRIASDPYTVSLSLPEQAIQYFDAAIVNEPGSNRYRRNFAFAKVLMGDRTNAVAEWQQVAGATTELIYWSDLAWNGCRCESSIPWLQVAVEVAPAQEQVETRYQLGLMYANNQMWDEARHELEALLSTEPKRADILLTLASIYFRGYREDDSASELLRQALALGETSAEVFTMAGNLLIEMADYADAEVTLRQALLANPGNRYTLISLGKALYYQYKFGEALPFFEKASGISSKDKQDSVAHFWLGRTYLGLGRFSEAIREFKIAVTISPENLSIYIGLGDAYAANGDYDNAADAYGAILIRNPDDAQATQRLKELPK